MKNDSKLEKKVFITHDNKATFVCPKCQTSKTTDVSQYKNIDKAIRVKCNCACGYSYTVLLERRQFYRKQVNFQGIYINKKNKARYPILVKDLSRLGLKFEPQGMKPLNLADVITVEFELDNRQKTFISKDVVVRSISGKSIGAEFVDVNATDASIQALNFYLFN